MLTSMVLGNEPPPVSESTSELRTVFLGSIREIDRPRSQVHLRLRFLLSASRPSDASGQGRPLSAPRGWATCAKWAVVGILTLAALLTPPDVITQLILFVVVYGLYEISIQLVRLVERQRNRRLRAEGILDEDEEF